MSQLLTLLHCRNSSSGGGGGGGGGGETFTNDPHTWWDFSDSGNMSLSGSNIESVTNKGSSSVALIRNSGNAVTFSTDHANCSGSQGDYIANSTSEFDFLHDGSGSTVFLVHNLDVSTTQRAYAASTRYGAGGVGFNLIVDARAAHEHYTYSVFNDSGASQNAHSPDNTLTAGSVVVYSARADSSASPLLETYEDGVLNGSTSYDPGFTAGDADDIMRFFVNYVGDVHAIVFYDRRLNDFEHNSALAWLNTLYGVS